MQTSKVIPDLIMICFLIGYNFLRIMILIFKNYLKQQKYTELFFFKIHVIEF